MARENQGAMIAIIILVLLLIISVVVAYMGINKANEYSELIKSMETKVAIEKNVAEAYQRQAQVVRAYIGFDGSSDITSANRNVEGMSSIGTGNPEVQEAVKNIIEETKKTQTAFQKDMAQFGSGEKKENITYRTVINKRGTVLKALASNYQVAQNAAERSSAEAAAEKTAREADSIKFAEDVKNLNDKFNAAVAEHAENAKKLGDEIEKLTDINKKINQKKEEEVTEVSKQVTALNIQVVDLTDDNNVLKQKVDEYERETFDVADGLIKGVSPEIEMVVINRGSADGLKTGRSFAVYSKDVTNFEKGRHKATIEITNIVGPHTAEARITSELDPRKPILTNDQILNAVWDPGFRVSIALAGEFDLDRDGFSDLPRLIQDIENNGGTVSAYNDENGELVGEITSATRYFVLGGQPDPDSKTYGNVIDAIQVMDKQAKEFAVQEISVDKLYRWMGKQRRSKIERLDNRIGEQFRRRSPEDSLIEDQ